MSEPFRSGEVCLLVDGKGRHYLLDLDPAATFHYHVGVLAHREIIGAAEGTVFRSSGDGRLVALRPRLADYILAMKRGAQVVYPKDIGPLAALGGHRGGDAGAGGRDGVGRTDDGPGAGGGADRPGGQRRGEARPRRRSASGHRACSSGRSRPTWTCASGV